MARRRCYLNRVFDFIRHHSNGPKIRRQAVLRWNCGSIWKISVWKHWRSWAAIVSLTFNLGLAKRRTTWFWNCSIGVTSFCVIGKWLFWICCDRIRKEKLFDLSSVKNTQRREHGQLSTDRIEKLYARHFALWNPMTVWREFSRPFWVSKLDVILRYSANGFYLVQIVVQPSSHTFSWNTI